ncbi:hypothetical protein [Phytomonospora endophytica]|uniref:Uncharacterized protein n=1 Tax=Phytomonospora endophytica TaxID=714109 RepID=A0A841FM19_9ACTN|nr:hypothetical protein [Phytomonospora endophytica]MBB6037196.1 hypothetical protein [Phytomonospora endophytica]GIG71303.1 hypothetical protein Pen01_75980 [Phytomonospora endophytica]
MLYIEATPEDTEAYVSRSELARRGWTPAMIRDLLDPPDQTHPNPVMSSRAPMRMYALSRVGKVEATEEFRVRRDRGRVLSEMAAERVARQRERCRESAERLEVTVPRHPPDELAALAIAHERERPLTDERLHRWQVEYLRSRLPSPEELMEALEGRPGRREAVRVLRGRVAAAITEEYPWLAEAVWEPRQPRRRASGAGRQSYPPPPLEATSAASS